MKPLDHLLRRAGRRLLGQSWLNGLTVSLTIFLGLAAVILAAPKLGLVNPLPADPWQILLLAAILGFLVSGIVAYLRRPNRLRTALAVDEAFQLKDRISSVVNLPEDLSKTPAGYCLLAETEREIEHLDLSAGLLIQRPRRFWMPLLPLALSLIVLFLPEYVQKALKAGPSVSTPDPEVVKKSEDLAKKLAEKRKSQAQKVSAPTAELMAELQKAAEDLAKSPPAEKSDALAALNELSDAVRERQKQMGSVEKMAAQLQQMKNMASDGPADEFAKDLAKGQFNDAAEELKSLVEKAQNGKLSDQDRQQLQKQLGEMAKQLEKMANLDEKKQQLDEALKNGGLSKEQYQEEMAKLNQQAGNMKQLQQLAQQMQAAEQAMQQGNMQKAGDSLKQAQQQLQQMAQEMSEMQTLDEALADLQQAKDGMSQDGDGNQLGDGMNLSNMLGGMPSDMQNGSGLNRGQGQGDRPEAPDRTSAYDTRVKMDLSKGKFQLKGYGEPGKQSSGRSVIEGSEIEAASSEATADALANQRIPRRLQTNVRDYFDKIQNPQ